MHIAVFVMNIFICTSYSRAATIPLTHDPCGIYSRVTTIQSAAFIRGNTICWGMCRCDILEISQVRKRGDNSTTMKLL